MRPVQSRFRVIVSDFVSILVRPVRTLVEYEKIRGGLQHAYVNGRRHEKNPSVSLQSPFGTDLTNLGKSGGRDFYRHNAKPKSPTLKCPPPPKSGAVLYIREYEGRGSSLSPI